MPIYQLKKDSKDISFLFIHIPKTGGTAIEDYFSSLGLTSYYDPKSYRPIRPYHRIPLAHLDYEMSDKLFNLDVFYSFAIVRNPIQRLISEYRWAIQKSTLPDEVKKYSFSEFIDFAFEEYSKDENFLAGHFKPQRRFVGSKVSKVFKYESGLNTIITDVFRDTGLKISGTISVPIINSSAKLPVKISEPDLALIRKLYADDFSQFGYNYDHLG